MSLRGWRAQSVTLETAARLTPWLILGYFALQFVIRIAISPYLETDEAQFVGHTNFALGYGNSHPPLYNWLVAGALKLTGGHWAAALALVKNVLLAGTYLLVFDIIRRITGSAVSGMIAAASLLFLPQIVWKSQITLAHSVLVMFAVVALIHAIVLIALQGGLACFLWLGLAASIGTLAKYNFVLSLAAIAAAALSVQSIRRTLLRPPLALSVAVCSAALAPHFFWAITHWGETTERLTKLEQVNQSVDWLDLPYIGIDGVLTALIGALTWAGPLVAVWFLIWRFSKSSSRVAVTAIKQEPFRRFFGNAALFGFLAFLLILAAGDLHYVHERYLTAVLMPLPFWLTLSWPLESHLSGARIFLGISCFIMAAMIICLPLLNQFGQEQLAYPYRPLAEKIEAYASGPVAVTSVEEKYAANIVLLMKSGTVWQPNTRPERLLCIWPAKKPKSRERKREQQRKTLSAIIIEQNYRPEGEPLLLHEPYENFSGSTAHMGAQLYVRKP